MKTIAILSLLLLSCFFLSAQDDIPKSEWQTREIKIDGKNNDWVSPFHFYDPDLGFRFDITNDDVNLYMLFMTNDPMKIQKLFTAGWKVQLSTKEKNKKFSSIITIPPVDFQEDPNTVALSSSRSPNDFNIVVSKYKLQLIGIKAEGFKTRNGDLPLTDKDGISIGIGADSIQNICYEISVPFNEIISDDLLTFKEILQLNVVINGYKSPDKKGNNQSLPDSKVYAGKYGYVNNPSYYYGSMYAGEMNDFFKDNRYKMKFSLAGKR